MAPNVNTGKMNYCILLLFGCCFVPCLLAQTTQCSFKGEDPDVVSQARGKLALIEKQITKIPDIKDADGNTYTLGVCALAAPDLPKYKYAGVTQKIPDRTDLVVIGRINNSAVVAGKDWVYLEYFEGDKYNTHCNREQRSAKIMFTCSPGKMQPLGRVVEENKNKSSGCYYLFEVETDSACPPIVEESHKLSPGSVICIVFLVLLGVYLIGGALYQRVIVGAKGMEQIPHYAFWQDFGNLQADGCDLICRSGGQTRGSREYRGIGDEQIHPSQHEEVGQDDNLLPM